MELFMMCYPCLVSEQPEQLKDYARVYGSPGEGARVAGMFRVMWPVLTFLLLTGYVLGVALPLPIANPKPVAGILLLLLAAALGYAVRWSRERFKRFVKGAHGEEETARLLSFLPAGYHVFHSLQLDRTGADDFDHIVIGPAGLFVIETKNWSGDIRIQDGAILVDGEEPDRSPLEQVKEEAAALRGWIREREKVVPEIRPVLCFASGRLAAGFHVVDGVVICGGHALHQVLVKQGDFGRGLDGVLTRVLTSLEAQVAKGRDE
jgi:hypothetical protein